MYLHSLVTKSLIRTCQTPGDSPVLSLTPLPDGTVEALTSAAVTALRLPSLKAASTAPLAEKFKKYPEKGAEDLRPGLRDGDGRLAEVVAADKGRSKEKSDRKKDEREDGEGAIVIRSFGRKKAKVTFDAVAPAPSNSSRLLFDANCAGHCAMVLRRSGNLVSFRRAERSTRRTYRPAKDRPLVRKGIPFKQRK